MLFKKLILYSQRKKVLKKNLAQAGGRSLHSAQIAGPVCALVLILLGTQYRASETFSY